MAKRAHISIRAQRLECRTRMIRGVARCLVAVVGLALGFLVIAAGVPQKRELDKLEAKLANAREREEKILAERAYVNIEHDALRNDREFQEIRARDPLDCYREGEKVLRFRRDR